jgi:hypothetical protein
MNLFQEFQSLIPKATQIIGVVQTENSDGTTSCLTLDNQLIRVKGVGGRATGSKVFIAIDPKLGSYILDSAPDLTISTVTIY